ncbi:MAG TPA: hypothetical protein VGG99_03610 [Acetobacteraceae bacterium]|jgi:hypothetical protein
MAMVSLVVAAARHYSCSSASIGVHLRFLFLAVPPSAMALRVEPEASGETLGLAALGGVLSQGARATEEPHRREDRTHEESSSRDCPTVLISDQFDNEIVS